MTASALTAPVERRRTPKTATLGAAALTLAAASVVLPGWVDLILIHFPLPATAADVIVIVIPLLVQLVALLLAVVLGIIAILTARGRWWGIAAVAFVIAGGPWSTLLVGSLFPPAGKG
jgi:hypothetical protein